MMKARAPSMMPTRTNIQSGDLVVRKYHIRGRHPVGVVVDRDRNGFLDVLWGSQVEHMWDDYDLMRINEIEEGRD